MMNRTRVGILVFPDVEVLDFCGPFEVFSVTRLDEAQRRETASPYEVFLVGDKPGQIVATGGLKVIADHGLDDCPALDIMLVPGGWGTRQLLHDERMLDWIAARGKSVPTLASVCTGALLLGKVGLLDGLRATTHWQALPLMRESFPAVTVVDDEHVVQAGRVITSAGISAGIDLALRIVARDHGESIARTTARFMEYPFPDENQRRI
jgi:transcriptional regulator GlxA family with amidase domain